MSLEIRVSDTQVNDLLERLQHLDLSTVSAVAAEHVSLWGTRAFRDSSLRPSQWAPLSKSYESKLRRDFSKKVSRMRSKEKREWTFFEHHLLIDTGLLLRSLRAFEVGERTADGGYVSTVASDRAYAAYHQFGTRKMPARPFIPIKADLSAGTFVLTDEAWDAIKPTLLRTLRRVIESCS